MPSSRKTCRVHSLFRGPMCSLRRRQAFFSDFPPTLWKELSMNKALFIIPKLGLSMSFILCKTETKNCLCSENPQAAEAVQWHWAFIFIIFLCINGTVQQAEHPNYLARDQTPSQSCNLVIRLLRKRTAGSMMEVVSRFLLGQCQTSRTLKIYLSRICFTRVKKVMRHDKIITINMVYLICILRRLSHSLKPTQRAYLAR